MNLSAKTRSAWASDPGSGPPPKTGRGIPEEEEEVLNTLISPKQQEKKRKGESGSRKKGSR